MRILAFLWVLSFSLLAENWPGWRGPRGDGRPRLKVQGDVIQWLAVPDATYQLEYTRKLGKDANWQKLAIIKNKNLFSYLSYKISKFIISPENGVGNTYVRVVDLNRQ